MLTTLSIRDVVLIERLDLAFGPGLTVLTGETGAGKSILLDALGLALGARAEAGLVRAGTAQASVAATFTLPAEHPALALLGEQGIAPEDELVLRRVLGADGRSRAFVNDAPVGAALLRRLGGLLVEVQGQHDQMGLLDPASHRALLDAHGVTAEEIAAVRATWAGWQEAERALAAAREAAAKARRDEEWLRHAVAELTALAPQPDEETHLAEERQQLQQGGRRAEAVAAALAEILPRDRRNAAPGAALRRATRPLQPAGAAAEPALTALERAAEPLAEAETLINRLGQAIEDDPRRLEAAEERLFALRGAARKHAVPVTELPALAAALAARLVALESGEAAIADLTARAGAAEAAFIAAATALAALRRQAAAWLERAVAKELPPLRFDRARFAVALAALDRAGWGPHGTESVSFLIATNPGQEPGPLARIASGGELSRLALALRVVLTGAAPVPTVIFDEVDAGIGGATAAAVGERLARMGARLQVLLVTHAPQVAARGTAHLRVTKRLARGRAETLVEALDGEARREEIARMLAGEHVTAAARAAADSLLEAR